jgi:hypothetical protein
MKFDQPTLKRICQEIFDGASMEQASLAVGCSRRWIYQQIEKSREARANDENISGTTDHILTMRNGKRPQWREIHKTVYHFSGSVNGVGLMSTWRVPAIRIRRTRSTPT